MVLQASARRRDALRFTASTRRPPGRAVVNPPHVPEVAPPQQQLASDAPSALAASPSELASSTQARPPTQLPEVAETPTVTECLAEQHRWLEAAEMAATEEAAETEAPEAKQEGLDDMGFMASLLHALGLQPWASSGQTTSWACVGLRRYEL